MEESSNSPTVKRRLRLLLVEDSEDDEFLLLRALRASGYDVQHRRVWTRDAMLAALDGETWDAVVSDYAIPGFGGPAALQIVRERGLDLPFIIVSGTVGDEEAVAAMRAGAHDYLMKDRLARLSPSLERELREAKSRRDGRAAQLATERANREKALAEAASAAKSLFLANASHELRTPLNAIIGFSELLTSDPNEHLTPRQREYLQHVLVSGRHLLMLINDILDLSKVEAGKLDLNLEPTSLEAVTRMALETLAPLAEKQKVTLQIAVDSSLPLIQADPLRLRQILYNLLSNAIKFTASGGAVSLHAGFVDRAVLISVTDTGVGIRTEDLPRLFGAFQQLPSSRAAASEGTGLGLALTKRLVELHGGTITVASVHGEGTTFTVRFPLAEVRRTSAERRALAQQTRILVIEDDLLSRRLACDVLRARGHRVVEAADADEAIAILKSDPPQIILTDIRVPAGGGERVLREVRQNPQLRSTPVLATTAHAMLGDRERLITQGFDEYISKPIDTQRLGSLVEAFIAKK